MGFYPRAALEADNGLQNRLSKIEGLVEECRFGIHDISRVESNAAGLPRFNMPFELGLFFGASLFGDKVQRSKNALVLERVRYSYQQTISDLNGADTKAHNNNPAHVIGHARDWLITSSERKTIPGPTFTRKDFEEFEAGFGAVAERLGFHPQAVPFNELCVIAEEVVANLLG